MPAGHDQDIRRDAATWFFRQKDGQLGADDQRAFEAWLGADARHAEAYGVIGETWGLAGMGGGDLGHGTKGASRRVALKAMLGLGVLSGAAAGGWYYIASEHPLADARTARGERRTVPLADGSRVDLATRTALSLRFSAAERRVVLHRGEAYFEVREDPDRPFVVEAADGETLALGTAFAVCCRADDVLVTVAEHSVSVAVGGRRTQVTAGRQVAYSRAGITPPEAVDLQIALAWRDGRLVFRDAPLREVADAVERWRTGRIVVMDKALATMPITAMLDLRRPDDLMDVMARTLPLRVVHYTPFLTLVYGADPPKKI